VLYIERRLAYLYDRVGLRSVHEDDDDDDDNEDNDDDNDNDDDEVVLWYR